MVVQRIHLKSCDDNWTLLHETRNCCKLWSDVGPGQCTWDRPTSLVGIAAIWGTSATKGNPSLSTRNFLELLPLKPPNLTSYLPNHHHLPTHVFLQKSMWLGQPFRFSTGTSKQDYALHDLTAILPLQPLLVPFHRILCLISHKLLFPWVATFYLLIFH